MKGNEGRFRNGRERRGSSSREVEGLFYFKDALASAISGMCDGRGVEGRVEKKMEWAVEARKWAEESFEAGWARKERG